MATIREEMGKNDLPPWRGRDGGFAEEWAAYTQALARVEALGLDGLGGSGMRPLDLLDKAAVALMNAAWHAGSFV